jgi:hypothetical protein
VPGLPFNCRKKEHAKEETERKSNLNQALVALARQYQSLENIKLEIGHLKEDVHRHVKLSAITTNQYSDIKIKIETLTFMLDSEPNLVMEIMLEQERFEMALKAVQLRAERHVKEFQPAYAKLFVEDGTLIPATKLPSMLGFYLLEALKNETDHMYKQVYQTSKSTLAGLEKLRTFAKQIYPNEKFIGIDPNISIQSRGE